MLEACADLITLSAEMFASKSSPLYSLALLHVPTPTVDADDTFLWISKMINDADLRRISGGTAEGGKDGKSTAEDWSATAPDARVLVESTARTSRKTRLQPKQKAATLQGTHGECAKQSLEDGGQTMPRKRRSQTKAETESAKKGRRNGLSQARTATSGL
jgi:hypothetical protein